MLETTKLESSVIKRGRSLGAGGVNSTTGNAIPAARNSKTSNVVATAMTLRARVIFVKEVHAGEVTSYNATWTAAKDTRLATIRLGYADGYPRALSNRAGMVLNGRVVPVAGRVCMDQTLLEIGDLNVVIGDEAMVFGPGEITAETIAGLALTNSYEILTGIGARVQRLYVNA